MKLRRLNRDDIIQENDLYCHDGDTTKLTTILGGCPADIGKPYGDGGYVPMFRPIISKLPFSNKIHEKFRQTMGENIRMRKQIGELKIELKACQDERNYLAYQNKEITGPPPKKDNP